MSTDIKFLQDLQSELNSQDNDSQAAQGFGQREITVG